MRRLIYTIIFISSFGLSTGFAQIQIGTDDISIDYNKPREFEIGGITVSGIQYLDSRALISLSGLETGMKIKIPGDNISNAIKAFWKQGLFSEVKITATKIEGKLIFLDIFLKERARLSKFSFSGVRRGEADNLREDIKLARNDVVTDNLIMHSRATVKEYFVDKGYLNAEVAIRQEEDTSRANTVILYIDVKKNQKVKIADIIIHGNDNLADNKIRNTLKKTKRKKLYHIFKKSKFLEEDFVEDKKKLIEKYNALGFRNAKIVKDSITKLDAKLINLDITVDEGKKFYFRNISWIGNSKYSTDDLDKVLKIKKGDIYNQALLEANLYMSQDGRDITSLYMDDGYLFFNITPVEIAVEGDSIDIELRIYEGKQARINKVTVIGNTKTSDHVILREIRTKPGQLFSRSDIIRSTRELAQLRYFDQEKLNVNPKPNPADGTVDIEYVVEETSSDQIELSGGWGAGRIVGTLGVIFNNFSARKVFKKGAWTPLPGGDGQQVSVRAQSNGYYYQSYNASFTEPWLGGKKPNALSVSIYRSIQVPNGLKRNDPDRQAIFINGVSVGLGKRLLWPDDYFTIYYELSYQNYTLQNYSYAFNFTDGNSNNVNASITIGRNSVDAPIYARTGSRISLNMSATPPFSYGSTKDYSTMTEAEKFKWIEYHKWKFNASWFTRLAGDLVLNTRMQYGFLGFYNRQIGVAPFERFYLGGDGLSGYALDSREIVALRGYGNGAVTPGGYNGPGAPIYSKYTLELRYPISLNPMATIFVLGFAEAGNSWLKFNEFDPFDVRRSLGGGVRIFLPMFGLLGLDYGWGFDDVPGYENKGQFHFSINQSIE
ncbi:MAG: outer membrane protein assembly factor BamA [Bacteroidetes bacterium]|nr:outer membrane protein assembly factor BamA [Bacteroidota bacterium]